MYMYFCYHEALKVYFYQLAEWLSVTLSCMQSPNSMRLSMLSKNVSASHCPLNVTSGMVWTRKGIDGLNPTTRNVIVPLYQFLSLSTPSYSPDWFCADFCKYISSIIKIQSQEKEPFWWTIFNAFNASTPPYWMLSNNGKDSIGNFPSNNLFTCSDV